MIWLYVKLTKHSRTPVKGPPIKRPPLLGSQSSNPMGASLLFLPLIKSKANKFFRNLELIISRGIFVQRYSDVEQLTYRPKKNVFIDRFQILIKSPQFKVTS